MFIPIKNQESHSLFMFKVFEPDNLIVIKDIGTNHRSVTNDIENVLKNISEKTGKQLFGNIILTLDTYHEWAGITVTWDNKFKNFYRPTGVIYLLTKSIKEI
jgi:hypothetical protein